MGVLIHEPITITVGKTTKSMSQWAKTLGVSAKTVSRWYRLPAGACQAHIKHRLKGIKQPENDDVTSNVTTTGECPTCKVFKWVCSQTFMAGAKVKWSAEWTRRHAPDVWERAEQTLAPLGLDLGEIVRRWRDW
jgi:hypothetical protein